MYLKNKENKEYTDIVRSTYNLLSGEFGYSARITDIWRLIQVTFNISEFAILRYEDCNNGPLFSYLIDRQIDWQNGVDVDFDEVYNAIIDAGDFTQNEKLLFTSGNIQERLWAIYLVICDPTLNL